MHATPEASQLNRRKTKLPAKRQPPTKAESPAGAQLTRFATRLVEGETRIHLRRAAGALFETDYHTRGADQPLLTVLWFNADASGFMDESKGDRILSVDYVSA